MRAFAEEFQPDRIEPLGAAGGFSGAFLWRLHTPAANLCLKRWPQQCTPERLQMIHAAQRHALDKGLDVIARPICDRRGRTWLMHRESMYEVQLWMAGKADYHRAPSQAKLRSALGTLAQLHLAWHDFAQPIPRRGRSPGLIERLAFCRRLVEGQAAEIESRLAASAKRQSWQGMAHELLALFRLTAAPVVSKLVNTMPLLLDLQLCLRDIWHDHVLFSKQEVSGLIDLGAIRVDSVCTDIARLLGSLVGDDAEKWQTGLDAYCEQRPLSCDEKSALATFDQSSVLLSGMNWLVWLALEDRQFPDEAAVMARLEATLVRLRKLAPRVG